MVNILSDTFEKVLGEREDREQWSERAVVVAYDTRTQSYDVIVSSGLAAGEGARTQLNRIIRKVKSLIPPRDLRFAPGDAVLLGYLGQGLTAEAREHPVILGAGDNLVQRPAKVKLGSSTVLTSLKGDQPINFATPTAGSTVCDCIAGTTQTPLQLNVCTGQTNTGNIDCTIDDPKFVAQVCGGAGPPYTWEVETTFLGPIKEPGIEGIEPTPITGNGVTITPPENIPQPANQLAFHTGFATSQFSITNNSNLDCTVGNFNIGEAFNCQDESISTCGNRPGFETGGGFDITCQFPHFTNPGCCCKPGKFIDDECLEETCLNLPCICPGPFPNAFCDVCPRQVHDQRTQSQLDDGCLPCAVAMDGAIVTVTDSEGNQVSIVMQPK